MIKSRSYLSFWIVPALLILAFLISACASQVPLIIQTEPVNNPLLENVLQQPEHYRSQSLRWGGIIIDTHNRETTTRLTVLAMPLDSDGEPDIDQSSYGRFMAEFNRFLEPSVYGQERKITVIGKLKKIETLPVGEYAYPYPVVRVEHHYLWPKIKPARDTDWPPYWWYDPWYHPYYYPYYPYPYHLRRR